MMNTLERISGYYPNVRIENIKTTWNRNRTKIMYVMGFGYCSVCGYMVKTDNVFCAICGKKFRRRTRNKNWSD
jgi:rRNA maturation endonuclease Nob1